MFGKPNLDGAQTGQSEINQFGNPVNPEGQTEEKPKTETPVQSEVPKTEEPAEEDLNEEGISADNIKMVMEYTKCSKAEAIRALRETEDDSVNAIMKLTKWWNDDSVPSYSPDFLNINISDMLLFFNLSV